jgi:hypothetical protein
MDIMYSFFYSFFMINGIGNGACGAQESPVIGAWGAPFCLQEHKFNYRHKRSLDSGIGIAMGYGMDGWVRFAAGERDLSLVHSVQTSFGAHSPSYPMVTGGTAAGM